MGFATLPNQLHRKSVKKGFDFTLMVAGLGFGEGAGRGSSGDTVFSPDQLNLACPQGTQA